MEVLSTILASVVLHPSAELITILVGIVLPLVTGIITKLNATSAVKAVANAVLSVVAGFLVALANAPEQGLDLYVFLYAVALAFVSSIASFHGIWKPTGIAGRVQATTADFGIGSSTPSV